MDACAEVVQHDLAESDLQHRYRHKGEPVLLITILIVLAIIALALYIMRGRLSRG